MTGAMLLAPLVHAFPTSSGHANASTPKADASEPRRSFAVRCARPRVERSLRVACESSRARVVIREDAGRSELIDGEPRPRREDLRDLWCERGRGDDDRLGGSVGDDLALGHHDDAVRAAGDELHVVSRDRDGATFRDGSVKNEGELAFGPVVESVVGSSSRMTPARP